MRFAFQQEFFLTRVSMQIFIPSVACGGWISIIIYSDLDSVFDEVVQFWWLKCCVVMMMMWAGEVTGDMADRMTIAGVAAPWPGSAHVPARIIATTNNAQSQTPLATGVRSTTSTSTLPSMDSASCCIEKAVCRVWRVFSVTEFECPICEKHSALSVRCHCHITLSCMILIWD